MKPSTNSSKLYTNVNTIDEKSLALLYNFLHPTDQGYLPPRSYTIDALIHIEQSLTNSVKVFVTRRRY